MCCSPRGHRESDATVTEAKPSLRCLGVCGNPAPVISLLYVLEVDADLDSQGLLREGMKLPFSLACFLFCSQMRDFPRASCHHTAS